MAKFKVGDVVAFSADVVKRLSSTKNARGIVVSFLGDSITRVDFGDTWHKNEDGDTIRAVPNANLRKISVKKNPSSRARKSTAISGRKGLSKTAYVNRPSQAPEHNAPSKRLKTRRKAALNAPQGYFPNPLNVKPDPHFEQMFSVYVKWPDGSNRYILATHAIGDKQALQYRDNLINEGAERVKIVAPNGRVTFHTFSTELRNAKLRRVVAKKNPVGSGIKRRKRSDPDLPGYRVESSINGQVWRSEGIFSTKNAAIEYAHALNRRDDNKYWYRVTV